MKEKYVKPVFDKAMNLGLNLWDTAAVYGEGSSERILGNFIKDVDRSNIMISIKFTPQIADDSEDAMQHMLDDSKKRLHTDIINIYWIHNPSDIEKCTPKLIALAKSGQIKTIGVSNHNLSEIIRANEILIAEGLHISAIQNHFSFLHRSSENAGIIEYCQKNAITFYSYMVLEQGALSGKYDVAHPFSKGSDCADSYNPVLPELEILIHELERIGNTYQASAAQIAIAWAIAKGTLPIIGVTKVKHVEDAAKAISICLTEEEMKCMETIAEKLISVHFEHGKKRCKSF